MKGLTDNQVEKEIRRLTKSEYVKLAREEQRERYRRRQYLYQLRNMEKRGKELAESGLTIEIIRGRSEYAESECGYGTDAVPENE